MDSGNAAEILDFSLLVPEAKEVHDDAHKELYSHFFTLSNETAQKYCNQFLYALRENIESPANFLLKVISCVAIKDHA